MRYFIEISYKGTHYFGWQRQPDAISVQEVLEQALSTLLRKEVKVMGAGRTDAGVHAKQLYAHFDFDTIEDSSALVFRLNSFLPKDVSVKTIFQVAEDAHARFHACEREYEYIVTLGKDPFSEGFSHQLHHKPDVALMNTAAALLLEYKDFQCFSRSNTDVKTYFCIVKTAYWRLEDNQLIFTIAADRFLRNMVRAIVGTLLDVGFQKTTLDEFRTIIEGKNRVNAGASAPAKGLFLTKVLYPEEIFKV
ncbi:tRNA pseudouridine(38-40) synthase TruA [Ulvibacter litoralis]|uniref:tRNA pseudouridine synthase A n=1 Tax=Ulvibacter litoralis TaxID=227084 RepID=A0A1G7GLY6_9FLAO|nr:tRNA pseudouridine(38-40) synthase TruA [Ulvibacter litoralis]GHC55718.1 tRNA pseudouridine synthase A [Ulvibacter litoralis]SDE89073.1 tRNA pseudouridine38-40 synthase [Ulvibacter litoralis]